MGAYWMALFTPVCHLAWPVDQVVLVAVTALRNSSSNRHMTTGSRLIQINCDPMRRCLNNKQRYLATLGVCFHFFYCRFCDCGAYKMLHRYEVSIPHTRRTCWFAI